MKKIVKNILNVLCLVFVFPCAFTSWVEKVLSGSGGETIFTFWTHFFAIAPGLPGVFLRRAFYRLVLDKCSLKCYIGFGSVFTHRQAIVEDNVSIGLYAVIGSVSIGKNSQIASRVSIVSGKHQHVKDRNGKWTTFDYNKIRQIRIAPNAWIGEGAVVMADIGEGSLVGAGAVVTKEMPANVVAAGNPAKILKKLEAQ